MKQPSEQELRDALKKVKLEKQFEEDALSKDSLPWDVIISCLQQALDNRWRHISVAPRDGTKFIGLNCELDEPLVVTHWCEKEMTWMSKSNERKEFSVCPTHWCPIKEHPIVPPRTPIRSPLKDTAEYPLLIILTGAIGLFFLVLGGQIALALSTITFGYLKDVTLQEYFPGIVLVILSYIGYLIVTTCWKIYKFFYPSETKKNPYDHLLDTQ